MRSPCLVVPRGQAEAVRRKLKAQGILRLDLRVRRQGDQVLLPVDGAVDFDFPVGDEEFEPLGRPPRDYRSLVGDVPADRRSLLPSSFDIVGRVAIIKVPPELAPWQASIGGAILQTHPRLKSVAADAGVEGSYRVRSLETVAGDPDLETIHREHGLTLSVDPSRAYFSPRLATERFRVARAVGPGEVVIDMFSGVGPFALMVARWGKPARVHALDANPEAFRFLQYNIERNRAGAIVVPALGDAQTIVPGLAPANRIIMDLPHSASEFLDVALGALAPHGIIHYYEILDRGRVEGRVGEILDLTRGLGKPLGLLALREVRDYSPREAHFALDLTAP